jgi:hypothetical protein
MSKFIRSSSDLPWACLGNFNEVLHRHEHVGVQERSHAQIAGFRDVVDVCGLQDLVYEGTSWTYVKKVMGGSYCQVRLDRALATGTWCMRFPGATISHLTAAWSVHCPILLSWEVRDSTDQRRQGKKLFCYEITWERHDEFESTLKEVWNRLGTASTLSELQQKIETVTNSLQNWGTNIFGNVRLEIFKLREDLKRRREEPGRTGPSHGELKTVERLVELEHWEEIM